MEEPLKPSAVVPTKTTGSLFFFALHCVSYVAFSAIAIVAFIYGLASHHYKMVFSIALMGRKDFSAKKIDESILLVAFQPALNEEIFPYHGMLMVPEKAITIILLLWMAIASIGAMVILILKGFKDNKVFSIAFTKYGKWTSIAMLCACAELLIPMCQEHTDKVMKTKSSRYRNIANLLLSMFALILIVLAYGLGEKCTGSDYAFYYKKICLSTFFAFHLLYTIFSLVDLEFFKKSEELYENDRKKLKEDYWEKKFYGDQASNSWAMMLLVGCSIAAIGYLNSDVTMPIFISVFNIGYLILSTGIPTKTTEPTHDFYGLKKIKYGNMVASLVMVVFLLLVAALIFFLRRDKIKQ